MAKFFSMYTDLVDQYTLLLQNKIKDEVLNSITTFVHPVLIFLK
jgi:hypothetical protein